MSTHRPFSTKQQVTEQDRARGLRTRRTAFGLCALTLSTLPLGLPAALLGSGCGPSASSDVKPGTKVAAASAPVRVRSFSDSRPVNCLAASSGLVWVGTSRGLVRWTTTSDPPTPAVLTTIDGLPSDKISAISLDQKGGLWVTTPKGVARFIGGSWTTYPRPPVGDLIAGMIAVGDGDVVWVGGSDGIARLKDGQWERFAAGTTVTYLAGDGGSGVWIGTSGKGILRVVKEDLLSYGMAEGNDIDNVRGLVTDASGSLLAIGEGPGGPRIAFFDGNRFWSYRVDAPGVLEWVHRVGGDLFLGSGQQVWSMKRVAPGGKITGPIKFAFSGSPSIGAPKAQPLAGMKAKDEPPPPPPAPVVPAAPAKSPEPDKTKDKDKGKGKKPAAKKTGALVPAATLDGDRLAAAAPAGDAAEPPVHPIRPWLVAGPGGGAGHAPVFDTEAVDLRLPDGVTSVTADSDSLYIGTRFLGVVRVQKGKQQPLRLFDLTAGAERLSVACVNNNDCYVATGGTQSWRFDGQSFEVTDVDPEKGSHVLAVVRDPLGAVIALHRGAASREVRISRVGSVGKWVPVGLTALEVPSGVPDLSFATFSPKGQLWVGLRYVDKDQDARAYGAAEVFVDDGRVIYHRQRPAGAAKQAAQGVNVPSDVTAIAWKGSDEAWLASRSGAVRLTDNKTVKVFTENDGLESELVHDVTEGLNGQMWVATSRGIGIWDGQRWRFPKESPYSVKASALARDPDGRIWIGTDRGVLEVQSEKNTHLIATRTGLLDDKVLNMGVDVRGRVWVLTEKGISVIEPLQAN
ncbi:MAG: two-component regulator propeller domain-containing protein [Polyangia bacterium]